MKLSSEMQEWVRKKKLQEIRELAKLRDIEIKRIKASTPRSGAQISAIADQHIQFHQKTIEATVKSYIEAFKIEEKVMDTDVIQGIVAEILYPWQNQKQALGQFEPNLGSHLQRIESDFQAEVNKARTDLFQSKTVMEIEEKKKATAEVPQPAQQSVPAMKRVEFPFMADASLRVIAERDYAELQNLDPNRATKSVLTLAGSIIEGLLIDAIITSKVWDFEQCRERQLREIIFRAKADGIIAHDNIADVVKTFRNLIHPAREIKDSLQFNSTHAVQSRAAVDVIIDDVRKWYEART